MMHTSADEHSDDRFTLHERMMAEAKAIIDAGRAAAVILRLTGGLAIRRYCTDLAFADRDYGDIDLVGHRHQVSDIAALFARSGFREDLHVAQATQGSQRQYIRVAALQDAKARKARRQRATVPATQVTYAADHVDVFLDQMAMDHVIDLRDRLGLDDYAISPADCVVTKLQIYRLAPKDIHDIVAIAKDVPLGRSDQPGVINVAYIAELCAYDWGLHTDITTNIEKCLVALPSFDLDDAAYDRVKNSLNALQVAVVGADKTLRWRLRSRIGKRMAWHREVEEQDRAPADIWTVQE